MDCGSEESPMASRETIKYVSEKQKNDAKKPKQSCGVLDLHGHPMSHDEDEVLHVAWHRNELKERGKGGKGKEIEWVVCKDQSKGDFLSHKRENMKWLISDHKVSEIKICLTTLEIVLI